MVFLWIFAQVFLLSVCCIYNLICCKGSGKSEREKKLKESSNRTAPAVEPSPPKQPEKNSDKSEKMSVSEVKASKNRVEAEANERSESEQLRSEKPTKSKKNIIKVREMSEESQMSKSVMKSLVENAGDQIPTEISNEIDDPFDCKKMPLPPQSLGATPNLGNTPQFSAEQATNKTTK